MKRHTHRAVKNRVVGWTGCVRLDGRCCDGRAHGGVTYIYTCSCGLERKEESTGRRGATVRQTWEEAEARAAARQGNRGN